jgi:hypothetical protein
MGARVRRSGYASSHGLRWSKTAGHLDTMQLAEALLCHLALQYATGVPGAVLCATLWPDSEAALAREALRSRVKSL